MQPPPSDEPDGDVETPADDDDTHEQNKDDSKKRIGHCRCVGKIDAPCRCSKSKARGMDRENSAVADTVTDKNMEAEAATKIQASFRGYQVRKKLKQSKKYQSGSPNASNQRTRANKSSRKNSGGANKKDLEEKSAVKIQAGVRGFLVRRRQQKQHNDEH